MLSRPTVREVDKIFPVVIMGYVLALPDICVFLLRIT